MYITLSLHLCMATTITALYKSFKQLTAGGFLVNANAEVKSAIEKASDWAIELNKDQLEMGLRSDGSKVEPFYLSDSYARKKNQRNNRPGFGVPDLKNTGNFYAGFYAVVKNNDLQIKSSDEKSQKLQDKYGKNIFGLTKDSKNIYLQVVREEVIKVVERKTGLKAS